MPRLFELPQHVRMPFEEPGQVSEYLDRIGAEVMFDAFDILPLRLVIQSEKREKSRKGFVPVLNIAGDLAALLGEDQTAIFFVVQVPRLSKLLNHAGDRGLLDLERGGDI